MIESKGKGMMNHATELENMSPEMLIRELAEILAGGFLRLGGHGVNSGDSFSEIEDQVGVTADTPNGCSQRNLPD